MLPTIFINCNWVSHPVAVVGKKVGKRQHEGRNNTQNDIKTQNTRNRKQQYKTKSKQKKEH